MTASAVSALSSVQANTDFPLLPGGQFVNAVPSSPLHGSDWQEYIPPSTLVKPKDIGIAAHTNFRILVPPNGIAVQPVSYTEAVNNLNNYITNTSNLGSNNKSILSGESPSSFACVYNQTTQSITQSIGCNQSFTTVNPVGGNGAIAIVDAYDTPTSATDLAYFSAYFGLQAPNLNVVYAGGSAWPYITATKPPTSVRTGWDIETMLDLEWAHAMAPNAKLFLVEAQSTSSTDLDAAVQAAQYLVSTNGGGMVSMSWYFSESRGENNRDPIFNNASLPQVVHLACSGDTGGKVVYPAASPYVIGIGGTTINRDANNNYVSETTWTHGGGGKSSYEPRPSFQNSVQSVVGTQWGTPDIAMDANPSSGVPIYLAGAWYPYLIGGTSLSAPLTAGIFNVANAANYSVASTIFNTLYNNGPKPNDFRDITSGKCGSLSAESGYDLCTG